MSRLSTSILPAAAGESKRHRTDESPGSAGNEPDTNEDDNAQ